MARILAVKIKEKGNDKAGCLEYKNEINFLDFKQLAIFFSDLETYGAKVDKAFKEFKKQKEIGWPFE